MKRVVTVKNKAIIISLIVVLCVGIIGAYTVLDSLFPKAEPISYPDFNEIKSVSIAQNKGDSITVSNEKFAELLEVISESEPTRKLSVNDYPTAETYYKIEVSANRMYCYFIYMEGTQVYVELPYEGIYKSDEYILSLVSDCLI